MPVKSYYNRSVSQFIQEDVELIIGLLTLEHHHALDEMQRSAWVQQVSILKDALRHHQNGQIFIEFYIPRMGKRADAVFVSDTIVFVIEFKVGATEHLSGAIGQVEDYALDLKNFHEGSHHVPIVPVLVSTNAETISLPALAFADDLVAVPVATNARDLGVLIDTACSLWNFPVINIDAWRAKGYRPTPTIIEAARVLYETHTVADISRYEAGATNLSETSASVNSVMDNARRNLKKSICFITGVPGSGKTLAGLDIATNRSDKHQDEHAVFLSGNGPLVTVLREALTRDKVAREKMRKDKAEREVRSFIQNIHHFRDEYLGNKGIPTEKVVVFDEAQRAWNREKTSDFMRRKRAQADFDMSEPEFLLSVMDRHNDWCTVVCLVGGGQEINTGEAGISEWMHALEAHFPSWEVYVSSQITLPDYGFKDEAQTFLFSPRVHIDEFLHLAVSLRSFRAEALSGFVGHIVDNDPHEARLAFESIKADYPIYITRDLKTARTWLRDQSRGSERFGLVASSGAQRLRPEGIHIKAAIEPANWFLNGNEDVRSSYFLEDVASEFDIQGLELDRTCVCWDGDFHHSHGTWVCQNFVGSKWQSVKIVSRRLYLKNAYRVLLTRARQGMVIFVPKGSELDHTRPATFYDGTFEFLRRCGIPLLDDK